MRCEWQTRGARIESTRGLKESRNDSLSAGGEESLDPTIWEHTLGHEILVARSACLQELARIPTGLGRLAYLAILQHRLLEDHEELFGEWRGCSLQQKYDWVYGLVASASHSGTLPEPWLSCSTYSDLVPPSVDKEARALYLSDIEAVLGILRKELVASSGPRRQIDPPEDDMPVRTELEDDCK
jgi:hypothetical protein